MKKIIVLVILFLSYSFDGNAQEKEKINVEKEAKKEIEKLNRFLDLDISLQEDLYSLFVKKHTDLAENPKKENKESVYKMIEFKLKATFTQEEYKKLESNKELLYDLIH